MDYTADITRKIAEELNGKLDNILIEGLRLKGYDVAHNFGIEEFVKTRCMAVQEVGSKTFYVDNEEFLIMYDKIETPVIGFNITASLGEYRYL